jgi:hypothetical protein
MLILRLELFEFQGSINIYDESIEHTHTYVYPN